VCKLLKKRDAQPATAKALTIRTRERQSGAFYAAFYLLESYSGDACRKLLLAVLWIGGRRMPA